MEHVWHMYGICMEYPPFICEVSPKYHRSICEIFTKLSWPGIAIQMSSFNHFHHLFSSCFQRQRRSKFSWCCLVPQKKFPESLNKRSSRSKNHPKTGSQVDYLWK